jgi:hypothetical protein
MEQGTLTAPCSITHHAAIIPFTMDHISLADELSAMVGAFYTVYHDLDDDEASLRPAEGNWSPKEIIGHMVDSASNNHQRWVRLQIQERLVFPDYWEDNERWVAIEHFNQLRFNDLLSLWKQYNVLLENIIRCADPAKLQNYWDQGDSRITLLDLMIGYVEHVKEHSDSIRRILEKRKG